MNKAKVLNGVSRYFLGFAFFEYSYICSNIYYNPAFNLGQVGYVDPALEGITSDEVYTLFTSIPNERARKVTHWCLLFFRMGAIMQHGLGIAYMWSAYGLEFKNRYPLHFIYCWVAFWMSHIDFSYGWDFEVGANTNEKYGYEPMASRRSNIFFMIFLLLVHGALGVLSVLESKAEPAPTGLAKVAFAADEEAAVTSEVSPEVTEKDVVQAP
jgi:hypothetical protein